MIDIQLHDKTFEPLYSASEIDTYVSALSVQLEKGYSPEDKPIILSVLNGAYVVCADVHRLLPLHFEISFTKVASYAGVASTGTVTELIGITEDLKHRNVIILEDIIDTGLTLEHLLPTVKAYMPASIKIATLFLKPEAFKGSYHIDYVGKAIANDFVVGYGMDYNNLGRNLRGLYKLKP